MPTIVSPYKDANMGSDLFGIGGLADTFFGPKASTAAYTREKFKEQQRQNIGTEELATLLQDPNAAPGALAAAAARGGVSSSNLGGYNQFGVVGRAPTIRDPSVARSVLQAGGNYGTTPEAFDINQANELAKQKIASEKAATAAQAVADNTPVQVRMPTPENPNNTIYVSRADAIKRGLSPVLSATEVEGTIRQGGFPSGYAGYNQPQLEAAGVSPKVQQGQNWVLLDANDKVVGKGRTYGDNIDADTKQPIPPGAVLLSPLTPAGVGGFTSPATPGKGELKDYRQAVEHANKTISLGTQIIDVVTRNPTVVGPVGNLRRMGQEGLDLLNSLNVQFGDGKPGGYEQNVSLARNELLRRYGAGAAKMLPELFDRDLNSVTTMNGMLLYKAAAALGQSGRDASDKDIDQVRNIVGDPASWWQGPNTYKDKVSQLLAIVDQQRKADAAMLQPGATVAPGATAPAAAPAPAGGSVPSGTTRTGATWNVIPTAPGP